LKGKLQTLTQGSPYSNNPTSVVSEGFQ